jgi:3'(2'), 5'-bisphosphate nucleotidase
MNLSNQEISQIIEISKEAGNKILEIYQSNFKVDYKQDDSPVTLADKLASTIIINGLKEIFPLIPAISEEEIIPSYDIRKKWDLYWLIDPLDGTKEFVNRTDEFTVNIALMKNNKPIFGIIYHPIRKVSFYASKDQGTYRIDHQKILLPKITIPTSNNKNLMVAGSRSHSSDKFNNYIETIKPFYQNIEIIRLGSSYKFCMAAEGLIDIYPRFGNTMEWDTAAGHIICNEVGKKIYQRFSKNELVYNKENLVNPWFIATDKESLERLKWIQA